MSEQTERPMCAHLRVSYRTRNVGQFTEGWWECDSDCGARFSSSVFVALLQEQAHDLQAELEAAKAREEALEAVYVAAKEYIEAKGSDKHMAAARLGSALSASGAWGYQEGAASEPPAEEGT